MLALSLVPASQLPYAVEGKYRLEDPDDDNGFLASFRDTRWLAMERKLIPSPKRSKGHKLAKNKKKKGKFQYQLEGGDCCF